MQAGIGTRHRNQSIGTGNGDAAIPFFAVGRDARRVRVNGQRCKERLLLANDDSG